MTRKFNFGAGPATLPEEVLQQAAEEMLDWHGAGMGVMEMSHRGKEFTAIIERAQADLRELLGVPDNYRILFMQGGAIAENAIIPLNLIGRTGSADYVLTGSWSTKSHKEATRYGKVHVAASAADGGFLTVPSQAGWQLSDDPSYLFCCTNETIGGVEYPFDPDPAALGRPDLPVVADMSSHILSKPIDVSRYGLIFAGAQKNIGPAGLTLVIVRDDLIGHASPVCPSAFDYRTVADANSMFNTPPTYAIYIAGLVFQWLKRQGGLTGIAARNARKSAALYDYIDGSDFYENRIDPTCRSRMNVPFFLKDESRNEAFLAGANAAGLLQLKGHKSVGGMRASIYNAMSESGVAALIDYMRDFATRRA